MSKKKFFLAGIIALTCGVTSMTAQVTIGADKSPEAFSVLELISNNVHGLRLPHLTTQQRDDITTVEFKANQKAEGLTIFNIDKLCVEVWNGTVWISMCGDGLDGTGVIPSYKLGCNQAIPPVIFAKTNLGADPQYDTPKKQMKYLTEVQGTRKDGAGATISYALDGAVFGGLYQWGRKDDGYAISNDGYYVRFGDPSTAAQVTAAATYDANGQILTYDGTNSAKGLYIYDATGTFNDWSIVPNNNLWGNGRNIDVETGSLGLADKGILLGGATANSNNYYQSTSWVMPQNNPCPSGWRIPTQDEWERLLDYGCNTQSNYSGLPTISTTNQIWYSTTTGFTWVRVKDGMPFLGVFALAGDKSGYAIYKTSVWNVAIATGGYFNGLLQDGSNVSAVFTGKTLYDSGAPEPFMFLSLPGYRPTAGWQILTVGYLANYLTSTTINNSYVSRLYLYGTVQQFTADRITPCSIRCVK